jgi:hypothetical protein
MQLFELTARLGVVAQVVLDAGLPERHNLGVNVLTDYKGELGRKFSARPGQLSLLRPDAYMAFQGDGFDVDALEALWRSWASPKPVYPTARKRGAVGSTQYEIS